MLRNERSFVNRFFYPKQKGNKNVLKHSLENYQPISILPKLQKNKKRLIFIKMCHLFVESSLINVKQSGLNGETLASSSSC